MFSKLKELVDKVLRIHNQLKSYEKDSVVQAMPSLAFVNRAKKCIEKQDYKTAEKILEEAMELPQEDALVYKYLGIVCEKTHRFSEAIISYKKSANINSADKDIWRLLGFALVNCNMAEEASESFENANKISPANTDVFAGWGMALMKMKRYEEAHEKFMESVRLNRYNFMSLLFAAVMEVRLNRWTDAEAKLKFLTSVSPNDANNYEYANLKYLKKDYKNAMYYANRALEYNKNILPVYLLLGKLYMIEGDKEKSLRIYDEALERGLATSHLYFDKAVTLQICEDYENSKSNFLKALTYAPEEAEAKAGLALVEACLGNLEEAEKILSDIDVLDSKIYLYSKAIGVLSLQKGEYKKAIEYFKSISDKMFFDRTINVYLAMAYDVAGDKKSAKEYFEKALLESTCSLNTYIIYSEFLLKQGEAESAQRKLRRALKFDENNLKVLNLLFYAGYILAKDNPCDYNMKETLSIADKILSIDDNAFNYPDERAELESMI